ncbi:4-fold beta flower protein [Anaerovorax sp. IOR16]|uniref:4-fold beta flower protein n=1 Tax=Anaerovorax sp. IOR16 TaxID=2773458 RepID=UPI0019D00AE1|nr:hypothetical protein [Anaerovorax sp. IOR16]
MRQNLWAWSGEYVGYRDGDNLWLKNGKHMGKFHENEVYDKDGHYMGEIKNEKRLIYNIGKSGRRKYAFAPYGNRCGINYGNYGAYGMYGGYKDFPLKKYL